MKFNEIQLDGFGRLVNRSFRFTPGLNLVFGTNEAGKSTLQLAILSLLYGFFDEGRIMSARHDLVDSFKPWEQDTSYAGFLCYTLDNGQSFRASRTFSPKHTTILVRYPDESDISNQFENASRGRLFFANAQLGMSKEVFENICYVRQSDLVALEASATAITETLMRLSASASRNTTGADAISLLEEAIKEQVGTQRARTKPLSKATECLAELEEERSQLLSARRELFSRVVELNQAEEQLQELELKRQRLRCLRLLAERDALYKQQRVLKDAKAEASRMAAEVEIWKAWAEFPIELRDDVALLTSQRQQLQKECATLEPQVAEAKEQLETVTAQIESVKIRLQSLEDARETPIEKLAPLRQMVNQSDLAHASFVTSEERWHNSQSALAKLDQQVVQEQQTLGDLLELGTVGLTTLEQKLINSYRREEEAAETLRNAQGELLQAGVDDEEFERIRRVVQEFQSGKQAPSPRKGCNPFAAPHPSQKIEQPPVELNIYTQIVPIYERQSQARAELQRAKTTRLDIEQEIKERLGQFFEDSLDSKIFAQLTERVERYQQWMSKVEQQRQIVTETKEEADIAREEYESLSIPLSTQLESLGLDGSDPHAALDRFAEQCERRSQLEREETALESLRLKAESLTSKVKDLEKNQAALSEKEIALCNLLLSAQIDCTPETIPEAVKQFGVSVENHQNWDRVKTDYQATIAHRDELARSYSGRDLAAESSDIESELAKIKIGHPDWMDLKVSSSGQEYESQIRQTDELWASKRDDRDKLRHIVKSFADRRHPAELDEEMARQKATIQQLESFRDTLELACRELTEAIQEFQKQFAPKVEQLMGQGLVKVTQGRYEEVQVDPRTLNVSLITPELGVPVSVDQLSAGTRDLVYLLLRVAIARLMSHTEENLPLLLDDSLVLCDRERKEKALQFLASLAKETQIIFFTKDESILEWFQEKLDRSTLHCLHLLVV